MKHLSVAAVVGVAVLLGMGVNAQELPRFACAADADFAHAVTLAKEVEGLEAPPFARTTHPDAQWFPGAGFGLFMHWGIHSVAGVQPSWAMIKDYPYGGELYPPERYYALADEFDPQHYDPNVWMEAAKRAGFRYAVLTAKHHDGYTLWPSAYGDMGTRTHMHGRDLLQPYVDACRKHGLKVGFYFSQRDWNFTVGDPARRYPLGDVDFDYNKRGTRPPIADAGQNRRDFEAFYAYTLGQLEELLTRYGKIDVLWFDGIGWPGIDDFHTDATMAWIRSLQPGIVINDRWMHAGDFDTEEWELPEDAPKGWWEHCISWNGHWGYNPKGLLRPAGWVIERLTGVRAGGGNFLLNIGPAPDGTMPKGFYTGCDELAGWMEDNGESIHGAAMNPRAGFSDVPLTVKGGTWYAHIDKPREVFTVPFMKEVSGVRLLGAGTPLEFSLASGTLSVALPSDVRPHEVVAIDFKRSRWADTMEKFAQADADAPPPAGAALFVGSSSIRMWDLKKSFPDLTTINRGFGGSEYADMLRYADQLFKPYAPRTVVLYSGDNDIAGGKSADWVVADFKALAARIRYALPEVPIIVLGAKPSIARWELWPVMKAANEGIAAYCLQAPGMTCLDNATPLLGADGKPRPELFLKDGLHLNADGYAPWADLVRPLIAEEPFPSGS